MISDSRPTANRTETRRFALALAGLVAAGLLLSACTPKTALRGNQPRETEIAKLEVGIHRKEDVQRLIGSPSVLGTFDANVWYYMSRKTEQWAFLDADVVEQKVLALYFDDNNVLQYIQSYDEEDARNVAYSDRQTPTSGRTLGFFEQLFGNFSKGGGLGN